MLNWLKWKPNKLPYILGLIILLLSTDYTITVLGLAISILLYDLLSYIVITLVTLVFEK